ncbi:MAG: DHH family phosphoesterase [Acidobacteriota bacterium]
MKSNELQAIVEGFAQSDTWTVVSHNIPDGDCIGSVTGLVIALESIGKKVTALIEDGVPELYRFLKGTEKIGSINSIPQIHDHVVFVDCSDPERLGEKVLNIVKDRKYTISIDHHISNTYFGDVNLVEDHSSSTCEILYGVIKKLGAQVTADIANALYSGMLMDSGRFQYSSTGPNTLRSAADLLELGADLNNIRTKLFESKSRLEIAVTKAALSSLEFLEDGRIAYMRLSYADMERLGSVNRHFEGIIDMARDVINVEVAVFFRELEPGKIKLGFRSKGNVDVNELAANWGGGGHRRAAGAMIEGSIDDAITQVVEKAKAILP